MDEVATTRSESTAPLRRRLGVAAITMASVYLLGTIGYFILGGGKWSLADCAYMTVISITTVGYGEVLRGIESVPYARLFTSALLLSGAGVAVYTVSVLTTFLVEGEFLQLRRRKRMRKEIERLHGHVIICGAGHTGFHIIDELAKARRSLVVIETDSEKITRCEETLEIRVKHLLGDATDDAVLVAAGIERAHGVVAGLPDDKSNLYVVLTARGINPRLRIVAKAVDPRAPHKLRVAGADSVVTVNKIGGLRLASEMIRPEVVDFLDNLVWAKDQNLRFEEIRVPSGSSLSGQALAQTDIRRERNLLVVAARGEGERYTYSPGPDFVLREGMTLILLGETDSVERLRKSAHFEVPE